MEFERAEWARLRANTPLTLSESDLAELQGLNERVSLSEVEAIYLPLSRLLNLHVSATQSLHRATDTFLGTKPNPLPYVIGVAGSVAVGKSTFARVLRALLAHWPDHPHVDLVTTDGFLYPNAVLEARGLMSRKGFPESYDVRKLVLFMQDIKAGDTARVPVYSHQSYDIIPDEFQEVGHADIVIVEGLNMLQTGDGASFSTAGSPAGPTAGSPAGPTAGSPASRSPRVFVSDFFDFSIYIDADEADIEHWYIDRFQMLRETVFKDPRSYFHRYASLTGAQALETARGIWREINGLNLRDNILPTRERARLVLEKGPDHSVKRVRLRTL